MFTSAFFKFFQEFSMNFNNNKIIVLIEDVEEKKRKKKKTCWEAFFSLPSESELLLPVFFFFFYGKLFQKLSLNFLQMSTIFRFFSGVIKKKMGLNVVFNKSGYISRRLELGKASYKNFHTLGNQGESLLIVIYNLQVITTSSVGS